jgi:hypothetical protein
MSNDLPPQLQRLYDELAGRGDVSIDVLFRAVFGATESERSKQQRLGPYITRLNRRLRASRRKVTPGRLKGTYVLAVL